MPPEPEGDSTPELGAAGQLAVRNLVSSYHASMVHFARSLVGDAGAEGIVQEAWVKIICALPGFQRRSNSRPSAACDEAGASLRDFLGRPSLRTWLFTIVRNEAASYLPADAPQLEATSTDALSDRFGSDGTWRTPPAAWSFDMPEAAHSKDMRDLVRRTLSDMPPAQRAIVTLGDMEGFALEDICNILEIPAANARALLHSARQRLWVTIDNYQRGDFAALTEAERAQRPETPPSSSTRPAATRCSRSSSD